MELPVLPNATLGSYDYESFSDPKPIIVLDYHEI